MIMSPLLVGSRLEKEYLQEKKKSLSLISLVFLLVYR